MPPLKRSRHMSPRRIQRSRAKGWRLPDNTVCVDRSTQWGNPYKIGSILSTGALMTSGMAVMLFELDLQKGRLPFKISDLWKLRGKNLACFCPVGQPCHADILLTLANGELQNDN